jgi:hypothetical protein
VIIGLDIHKKFLFLRTKGAFLSKIAEADRNITLFLANISFLLLSGIK